MTDFESNDGRFKAVPIIKQFYSPELKNACPQEVYTVGDDEQRDYLKPGTL